MNAIESAIAGALFDFAGYLTTLENTMRVGASELSTPIVEALSAWAKTRGLTLSEADVKGWDAKLRCGCDPDAAIHDFDKCTEFAKGEPAVSDAAWAAIKRVSPPDYDARDEWEYSTQDKGCVIRTRDEWDAIVRGERAADCEVVRLQAENKAMADRLIACHADHRNEVDRLQADAERERLRLAACGVAALGYFTGCADEYRSASLADVLRLYAENERLRKGVMQNGVGMHPRQGSADNGNDTDSSHAVTGAAHRKNAGLSTQAPVDHRFGTGT